jgi:hypothetical protein
LRVCTLLGGGSSNGSGRNRASSGCRCYALRFKRPAHAFAPQGAWQALVVCCNALQQVWRLLQLIAQQHLNLFAAAITASKH